MIGRLVGLLALLAGPVGAVTCEDVIFDSAPFTLCEVDASQETIRLFLDDEQGAPYGHFSTLRSALEEQGLELSFAMNAGMYHDDRTPVGHYMEDGKEIRRTITSAGPGNFGLLPNGVFCIQSARADVIETLAFHKRGPDCNHATQSGPMLVIDGKLHPRFLKDGTSRYIRNGVGSSANGKRIVFAISNEPVNFHLFARLFRDHADIPNALYFDGKISRIYTRRPNRYDLGWRLGPIVGVVTPK